MTHSLQVTITPEIVSKKVSRKVIGQLVLNYKQSHLGNRILAYDGRRSAYTAGPLPFTSAKFDVVLPDDARWLYISFQVLFLLRMVVCLFVFIIILFLYASLIPGDKGNSKFQSGLLLRLTFIIFWNSLIVIKLMHHKRLYRLLTWFLDILHLPSEMFFCSSSFYKSFEVLLFFIFASFSLEQ